MIKKSTYITSLLFAVSVTIIITLTIADKARPVTQVEETLVTETVVEDVEQIDIVEDIIYEDEESVTITPVEKENIEEPVTVEISKYIDYMYPQLLSYDYTVTSDGEFYKYKLKHTNVSVFIRISDAGCITSSQFDFTPYAEPKVTWWCESLLDKEAINLINSYVLDIASDAAVSFYELDGDIVTVSVSTNDVLKINLETKELITE